MQHKILYNFNVDNNLPLDVKYVIESITQQIPLHQRHEGLLCYSKEQKSVYIYENVNSLVPLFSFLSREFTGAINSTDYANLLNQMLLLPNMGFGDMVTVFPMGVTYVFDNTKFVFRVGPYKFTDISQYNSLSNDLKEPNQIVYINDNKYIINNDFTLSPEVEVIISSTQFVNNRYYTKEGQLYYFIDNKLYVVGDQIYIDTNFNLTSSVLTVNHNLNTTSPLGIFLYLNDNIKYEITDYTIVSSNTISFESYVTEDVPLKLIIKTI